jgi:hypothetical protein
MSKKLKIQAMHELAERHGGRCLSDIYVNSQSKLLWQCAKGHQWTAIPTNVQRGHWCPVCAGVRKLTIEEMRHLAATRGGKCLSDIYVNAQSKLIWQCAKGHQWTAIPTNVQRGHWCLSCAGKAMLTIQEMRSLAESRGGKCLSDIYVNSRTPLLWECRAGHRWKAAPSGVKSGKWCSICAGIGKPSMEDIQHLANERGGKCLSDVYVNNRENLLWELGM